MKQKITQSINETDIISSVPASAYFIETCSRAKNNDLGSWLSVIDSDSLEYVLGLFKPNQGCIPEGMSLPVCDIVSLCLVIMEWESGKKFDSKDAWENSQPLIPRLRRAVILESLSRQKMVKVLKTSIQSDDFTVEFGNSEKIDSMLAGCLGLNLSSETESDSSCDCSNDSWIFDIEDENRENF